MSGSSIFSPDFLWKDAELATLFLSLVKGGLSKLGRDEAATLTASYINRIAATQGVRIHDGLSPDQQSTLTALMDGGYAAVPNIFANEEIDAIQSFLADKLLYFDNVQGGRGAALKQDLPANVRRPHYAEADLCASPTIYRVLHDHNLINLVSAYLKAPATISAVAMWWSFPDVDQPDANQLFHHDRDDFNITKLFVYFTDVTETSGPHAYVLGTHTIPALQKSAAGWLDRAPKNAKILSQWLEKFFKPDHEVLEVFGPGPVTVITGPRGSSFIEDARGLHRAVYPRAGSRLAFEITFTVLPKYNEAHAPVERAALDFAQADLRDPARLSPLVRYATRLIYV